MASTKYTFEDIIETETRIASMLEVTGNGINTVKNGMNKLLEEIGIVENAMRTALSSPSLFSEALSSEALSQSPNVKGWIETHQKGRLELECIDKTYAYLVKVSGKRITPAVFKKNPKRSAKVVTNNLKEVVKLLTQIQVLLQSLNFGGKDGKSQCQDSECQDPQCQDSECQDSEYQDPQCHQGESSNHSENSDSADILGQEQEGQEGQEVFFDEQVVPKSTKDILRAKIIARQNARSPTIKKVPTKAKKAPTKVKKAPTKI